MKNRKLLIIICISLLSIILIAVCLLFTFGKNEKVDSKDNSSETAKDKPKKGYDEFGNKIVVPYEGKDAVYNAIVNDYLGEGETIVDTREENGCWYFNSSNGRDEYEYCVDDPVIRVTVRQIINIK